MMKFKRWQIISVLALMIVAGLLAWFRVSYSPLKNIFQERVEQEKQKTTAVNGVFSSEDFSQFPEVIQRYMTHCGYVGTPKMSHMRMVYGKVNFKMNRSSQAMRVEYVQYNFASYPSRLALIDASIFGIPFEGMDYYYEGHGGMKGVLAKLIPLFDQQGEEMNRSCLVTYLAECLFMPMALMENDIKFEVIPGVTSAIGAPTSLGLPVTHRAIATSVTLVTGHEDPTKKESQVKWDYTADTLVILMGIGNIKENTSEIMKYRSGDTPVCVIESGTLPDENVIFGTLENIADKEINTPAILIIGDVVSLYKDIYNY